MTSLKKKNRDEASLLITEGDVSPLYGKLTAKDYSTAMNKIKKICNRKKSAVRALFYFNAIGLLLVNAENLFRNILCFNVFIQYVNVNLLSSTYDRETCQYSTSYVAPPWYSWAALSSVYVLRPLILWHYCHLPIKQLWRFNYARNKEKTFQLIDYHFKLSFFSIVSSFAATCCFKSLIDRSSRDCPTNPTPQQSESFFGLSDFKSSLGQFSIMISNIMALIGLVCSLLWIVKSGCGKLINQDVLVEPQITNEQKQANYTTAKKCLTALKKAGVTKDDCPIYYLYQDKFNHLIPKISRESAYLAPDGVYYHKFNFIRFLVSSYQQCGKLLSPINENISLIFMAYDFLSLNHDNKKYSAHYYREINCPITLGHITDPIETKYGGLYERKSLQYWEKEQSGYEYSDPGTNLPYYSNEKRANASFAVFSPVIESKNKPEATTSRSIDNVC